MTLRDLRWKLADAVWAPGARVEIAIEEWQHLKPWPTDLREKILAGLELLPGFRQCDMPLRLRLGRVLIVAPSYWLSELIYSGMAEDERASLSYWQREAPRP